MNYPAWTLGRFGLRLVDRFRKTDSLALYPEILDSQWRSAQELRDRQWEALLRLLRHASRKVPYYRRLFQERGLSLAQFQEPADLQRLPPLSKEIIRAQGAAMFAEDFADYEPRPKATSGSTGVPLNYFIDRLSHGHHWAFIWRAWAVAGFQPGQTWAALSGGALLPAKVDFRQKTYIWLNGALHLPSYHLRDEDLARYAELVSRHEPALFYGYPSSLRLFARWLQREERRIPSLPLFTTSELLPAPWRREIEAGTGGRVYDIYGNNDGGALAFECERHDGYHLNVEGVHVEIVDEQDAQLAHGEEGEVLVTNLLNYAMPFIRYAPGDRANLNVVPCPCGRGLDRLASLGGRVRDFILTPDGRHVHGAFFNHFEPFYQAQWIEAFQVRQREAGSLTLVLQPGRKPQPTELDALLSELRRGLGEDMRIDFEFVDAIPRGKAGKYRLIVSELAD